MAVPVSAGCPQPEQAQNLSQSNESKGMEQRHWQFGIHPAGGCSDSNVRGAGDNDGVLFRPFQWKISSGAV